SVNRRKVPAEESRKTNWRCAPAELCWASTISRECCSLWGRRKPQGCADSALRYRCPLLLRPAVSLFWQVAHGGRIRLGLLCARWAVQRTVGRLRLRQN